MTDQSYTDLALVAHEDQDAGLLVISTTVNGATVPIATQKLGHYQALVEQGRQQAEREQQDAQSQQQDGTQGQ